MSTWAMCRADFAPLALGCGLEGITARIQHFLRNSLTTRRPARLETQKRTNWEGASSTARLRFPKNTSCFPNWRSVIDIKRTWPS